MAFWPQIFNNANLKAGPKNPLSLDYFGRIAWEIPKLICLGP